MSAPPHIPGTKAYYLDCMIFFEERIAVLRAKNITDERMKLLVEQWRQYKHLYENTPAE